MIDLPATPQPGRNQAKPPQTSEKDDGRATCHRCRRAQSVCLCKEIATLPCKTQVIILAHPREARRATATGWMLHLSLPNSIYHVVQHFQTDDFLQANLGDPSHTYLLFPSPQGLAERGKEALQKPRTIILIEGTWSQAAGLLKHNPGLATLPRIALEPSSPSNFRIRTQPRATCLSTIEAASQFLLTNRDISDHQSRCLLRPFEFMVTTQMACQIKHHPGHRRRWEKQPVP